jgi:hypothetical protein
VSEPLGLEVEGLLETFEDVFAKPKRLPPNRSHDHAITLKTDVQPVRVRPYIYPYFQKEKIEKIVGELLTIGVIKPSQSPFSSPILLVRKPDGSWHMCIDYRALNKETIKDKFHIHVIDELLDELHGSMIFFKVGFLGLDTTKFGLRLRTYLKLHLEHMKGTMNS